MDAADKNSDPGDGSILIVDDDPSICDLLRMALTRSGFGRLSVVSSGADTLRFLGLEKAGSEGERAPPPGKPAADLVLMDVMLPDLSGFDICSRVKRRFGARIVVILMSGYSIEETHARYVQAGADDFLPKPFNLKELVARVKLALRRKREAEDLAEQKTARLSTGFRLRSGMLEEGDEIKGYVVHDVLSWGGASVLYKVTRDAGQTWQALKLLSRRAAEFTDVAERFVREVEFQRTLDHPNIIRIVEAGRYFDCPYYVMEHIDGQNLERVVQKTRPLPFATVFTMAVGIAHALKCIHDQGVLHRDVSLGNVLWDACAGQVKMTDFGISIKMGQTRLTQHGCAVGTPLYMAPEMFEGEPVLCPATDIYSYGACVYHLIAGRPPFLAENAIELARQHINETPQPMRVHRPTVAPEWDELVLQRCLAKAPEKRMQTMDAVLESLEALKNKPF
jgi:serine/threonine-protein kinase